MEKAPDTGAFPVLGKRAQKEIEKMLSMTVYESKAWDAGLPVAGIDEVGRGPLAGPVVTACVSIPRDKLIPGVNDSKKLSESRREALYPKILESADYCRTAFVDEKIIDDINILRATRRAMETCAAGFSGHFLVDAVTGLALPGTYTSVIHGDALCFMIAAASIVAKVERDRFMVEMDALYPEYGFARNKGYGTAEHIAALRQYGPCPLHRQSFLSGILHG